MPRRGLTVEQRIVGDMELGRNECWLFTGPKDENGYGRINVQGRMQRTHRLMWELANGEIPEGMVVCHGCDTPACVRPTHLFLGTQRENIEDARREMRMTGRAAWTTCMRGHEWTPENTFVQTNGAKTCRICRRASSARAAARKAS